MSTYAIGYDLFTGSQHSDLLFDSVTLRGPPQLGASLSQVYIDAPHLAGSEKSIFLIYGVDGMSFRDGHWTAPEATLKQTNIWTRPYQISTNDSSIMALVIWPEPVATSPMRVSLYTGGDAKQDPFEDDMIQWFNVHIQRGVKLDVVKASHHGSHFSTNEQLLLQTLQYLIISAGK